MDIFKTVVQLTVITKVMALNFEGLVKSMPVPADLKAMILDMHEKQQEFSMPNTTDNVTLMDFTTATPFVARKANEIIKPASALAKRVTELNKPVTPSKALLRTSVTLEPGPSCVDIQTTTAKSPIKPLTLPPPFLSMPMPIPMPMQMAMPIYARLPIILPMRSYFETVKHDHPPLYKMKRMIEEEEKKWKQENEISDSEISVEIDYGDVSSDQSHTDTDDSDWESNDVGSEYYDDFIKVNV